MIERYIEASSQKWNDLLEALSLLGLAAQDLFNYAVIIGIFVLICWGIIKLVPYIKDAKESRKDSMLNQ